MRRRTESGLDRIRLICDDDDDAMTYVKQEDMAKLNSLRCSKINPSRLDESYDEILLSQFKTSTYFGRPRLQRGRETFFAAHGLGARTNSK